MAKKKLRFTIRIGADHDDIRLETENGAGTFDRSQLNRFQRKELTKEVTARFREVYVQPSLHA